MDLPIDESMDIVFFHCFIYSLQCLVDSPDYRLDYTLRMSEEFEFKDYSNESVLPAIQKLVSRDLSEPYSVFTYRYCRFTTPPQADHSLLIDRYFLHGWPELCICVFIKTDAGEELIGTIVGKAELDYDQVHR